jgi:capsular polysaccharide biosynthesis protein
LLAEYPRSGHSGPVFLAKTDVKNVVHGAVNEGELIFVLEREGVEIIHPQKLPIAGQAAIWRDRAHVFGSAGSALHSSILWEPGAQIVACSWQPGVHTNCGIIDVVNKNRIAYTFPQTEPLGRLKTQHQNIEHAFRLNHPTAAAHEMLRAAGL